MKKKIAATTLSAAVLTAFAFSASSAHAGFGVIPGDPAGAYGGTGIPTQPSSYAQGGVNGDTLTIALSTTAHGASNPAPTTTTPGVFNVGTGLDSSSRSLWNYDY